MPYQVQGRQSKKNIKQTKNHFPFGDFKMYVFLGHCF
jgi:hypothetical protein